MLIRSYCDEKDSTGHDEGGFFKMIEAFEIPARLKKRMKRCAGCHDDFYNYRENCSGSNCWSLKDDSNFKGRNKPLCYH